MIADQRRAAPGLAWQSGVHGLGTLRKLAHHRTLLIAALLLGGLGIGTSEAWTSVDTVDGAGWTTAPLHVLIYALALAIIASGALRSAEPKATAEEQEAQLANLSHGLRTPLNAVIGFSELMLAEVHGPLRHPKYVDYARHVSESGMRLAAFTEQILRSREPISPDALIEDL